MKYVFSLAIAFFPIHASAGAPFEWPARYTITYSVTGADEVGGSERPFINRYSRDGLKARNELVRPGRPPEVTVFRLDLKSRFTRTGDGVYAEERLPDDWPLSDPFRTDGAWEVSGGDTVRGQPAIRYTVSKTTPHRSQAVPTSHFTAWLSADGKTPLRLEEGRMVMEFSGYSTGPIEPGLFEKD